MATFFSASDISNFIHCGQTVISKASKVSAYILETTDSDKAKLKSFSTLTWYELSLNVIASFIVFVENNTRITEITNFFKPNKIKINHKMNQLT